MDCDPTVDTRRHDLDWIRVIAFALLIFFHIGIGFVPWNIYAFENNETSKLLELILIFVNQWRLPLLFTISGMGTYFALAWRSGSQFVGERTTRLIIPLIFGANAVVLFHGYYIALYREPSIDFLPFAVEWWKHGGEVKHLWFILWLYVYSVVALPVFQWLRNKPGARISMTLKRIIELPGGIGLLLLFPLPLVFIEWLFKPAYPGPTIGYMIPWYFVHFVYGFLIVWIGKPFWVILERMRVILIVYANLSLVGLLFLIIMVELNHPGDASILINGGWVRHNAPFFSPATAGFSVLHVTTAWFWCLLFFAWGHKHLNKPSRALRYLNQAVYPFFIVHLPFTFITLYYVKDWQMWWPLKFCFISIITFLGCLSVFELAKRNTFGRLLFGIKPLRNESCAH